MFYRLLTEKSILLIIILAFILRVWDISFPFFSSDEVRVALRGYYIAENLTDELGRKTPLIFNGSKDFEFPLTSYLTGLGVKLFGKNDYGTRIPFIVIGVIWIWLLYKVIKDLFKNNFIASLVAFIVAISPVTVFLSKVPNEFVISWLLITLLFFLLIKDNLNSLFVVFTIFLLYLTSKDLLIITLFFVFIILFFKTKGQIFNNKKKLTIFFATLVSTFFCWILFLSIPQAIRSLAENNLSLITNPDNQTNLNLLRGHGLKEGINPNLEKLLFNKLSLLGVAVINYLGYFNPLNFFGNIYDGSINFSNFGLLPKAVILPFVVGLYYIIKLKQHIVILLIMAIFFLNALFIFPGKAYGLILNSLPFVLIIIGFGIKNSTKVVNTAVIFLIVLESILLFSSKGVEAKKAEKIRGSWVLPIVKDAEKTSKIEPTYVSDNLVNNFESYLAWFTDYRYMDKKESLIKYPYKYSTELGKNIKYIHDDSLLTSCILKSGEIIRNTTAYVSPRDYRKVAALIGDKYLNQFQTGLYYDSFGNIKAYIVRNALCY